MKPKTAKELQRLALERGATLKLDGREFNSQKEIVRRRTSLYKPEATTAPKVEQRPEQKPETPAPIAALNERLLDEIKAMTAKLSPKEQPHGWKHHVIRDENGRVMDIISTPLDDIGALAGLH